MNALQQLIADYLDDHPHENYSTIAKRGDLPRQTVYAIARRPHARQVPLPPTVAGLAKGLETSEKIVRSAAHKAAGYDDSDTQTSQRLQVLVENLSRLDDERIALVARRIRALLNEQNEEEAARRAPKQRDRRQGHPEQS